MNDKLKSLHDFESTLPVTCKILLKKICYWR